MNFKVPSNPNFFIILWNVSWRHSQDVHAMVTPTLPMLLTAGFASAYNRKCSFHWVGYGTSHLLRLRLTIFSFHFEDRQHTWGLLVACLPLQYSAILCLLTSAIKLCMGEAEQTLKMGSEGRQPPDSFLPPESPKPSPAQACTSSMWLKQQGCVSECAVLVQSHIRRTPAVTQSIRVPVLTVCF